MVELYHSIVSFIWRLYIHWNLGVDEYMQELLYVIAFAIAIVLVVLVFVILIVAIKIVVFGDITEAILVYQLSANLIETIIKIIFN